MKRVLGVCLAGVLLVFAGGCGSSESDVNPEAEEAQQEVQQTEQTQESEDVQEAAEPEEETETQENTDQEDTKMKIQVGDTTYTVTLAENSSVDALKALLADGPMTLDMHDYAGMEKGADLAESLPQNNQYSNTQAGDIILYQGRTLVIYYDTNSWSLTPIGKIDNVDASELRNVLGDGDVTVTFSLED